MRKRRITLEFPVGGINRVASRRMQPPYTSEDMQNVSAFDVEDRRGRGGSRRMLSRAYSERLGTFSSQTGNVTNASGSVVSDSSSVFNFNVFASVGDTFQITQTGNGRAVVGTYTIVSISSDGASLTLNTNATDGGGNDNTSSVRYTILGPLGAGRPINMMSSVAPISAPSFTVQSATFSDQFSGSAPLNAADWPSVSGDYDIESNYTNDGVFRRGVWVHHASSPSYSVSAYARLPSNQYIQSVTYNVRGYFAPVPRYGTSSSNQYMAGKYYLYAGLDNTTPSPGTHGITFWFQFATPWGANNWRVNYGYTIVASQVPGGVVSSGGTGSVSHRTMQETSGGIAELILQTGSSGLIKSVTAVVDGETLFTFNNGGTEFGDALKHRTGFRMDYINYASLTTGSFLDYYELSYKVAASSTTSVSDSTRRLVACSGAQLYYETTSESLASATSTTGIRVEQRNNIQSIERGGTIYIADHTMYAHAGDGTLASDKVTFDSATYGDWKSIGIASSNDVLLEIASIGTGGHAFVGRYGVSSISSGSLTLSSFAGDGTADTSILFRVVKKPKRFDIGNTPQLTEWIASTGTIPIGCPLIALFQDCVYMGGAPWEPGTWYKSRQGDPTDWNYGGDPGDAGRAIAGASTQAGIVPDALTAIAAHYDDFLIFASSTSIYIIRGNPLLGAPLTAIDRTLGVISRTAWCYGPSREFVFLSSQGLCVLGADGTIQMLSRDRVPVELRGLNVTLVRSVMLYNPNEYAYDIFLTPYAVDLSATHWRFDIRTGGFFKMSYQKGHQPASLIRHRAGSAGGDSMLMGCNDGYVRTHDSSAMDDDGESVSSYVWIGPLYPGGSDGMDGMIDELTAIMAAYSGQVDYSIHTGDSAESARTSSPIVSGSLSAGRNHVKYLRARGNCAYVKLSSLTSWSADSMELILASLGRYRKP